MKRKKLRHLLVLLLSLVVLVGPAVAKVCRGPVEPPPMPPRGGPLHHPLVGMVLTVIQALESLCI
jgi:hypothetical protein